ncbi:hypothetical protein [uncultured Aquimarina sp.]|uniref:hypothetical protein n=1 Tax=uncultured Aquimarina sp. TaxID=575652 RepID=UPI002602FF58|nr:hypothetical protein [uncultured Aquimarina sp.]
MGNILYVIGYNKSNYLSFSKKSILYKTLEKILRKIDNVNLRNLQNQNTFTIDNNLDLELILNEIKSELFYRFNKININFTDDNQLITKLLAFRRENAHFRDNFYSDLRVLIKLYSSFLDITRENKKVTFLRSMSDEKNLELKD